MKNDLKFCLFGRGSIGIRRLKNLRALSCENIIAYSEFIDKEKDEEFRRKYGVDTLHSLEEVEEAKPDVFIIANPTSRHLEFAQLAVSMGSHIFMEKPLSNNLEGVEELKEKLSGENLRFCLANNFRFHPALIKIKSFIENNRLGNIYFARIMAGQYLPDWHPWEDYRKSYSARKELGGGVVLTLQHEVDYAYWLFGAFKSLKSEVRKISDLEIDVEDMASVVIEAGSGPLINLHVDYLQRPPKRTVHIQGSDGSIDYCFTDQFLKFYDFKLKRYDNILDLDGYDNNRMYIDEMKHFIKCVVEHKEPASGIDDAIYVLRACLDIKREFQL